ncbi:hypothetical protein OERS_16700 [Oerskovia enterophila]|uniref:Uncharacterized protein n=1 Tax=Oerskovia enterophila TaxID=43678 RepID=A0ABX2Y4Q5_9CELL|nr:hypothetical protein OERS_16700 [Oerskovia enterophila]
MATTCCARTSSGFESTCRCSICPVRMRSAITAEGTRSPRKVGNTTPWDTAPTWWPARPMRWSPLATEGGAPTWTTRSTAPMSMPSSSEDVATTAGRRPSLSSVSVRVRSARLMEPWWARAITGSVPALAPDWARTCAGWSVPTSGTSSPCRSAQTSFMRAVSRSAPRRELVKTSVERCSATRSTTRSSTCGHTDGRGGRAVAGPERSGSPSGRGARSSAPVALLGPGALRRSERSGTGTTMSTSIFFSEGGCTTTTSRPWSSGRRCPARKVATASTGRTVAESPTRCAGTGSRASSRSSETARCAPRLVPATAWISSMMTVCTPASPARACEVRTRNSDSGVVMRMSGGATPKRRRSLAGVSPVRVPTTTSGTVVPSRTAACRMPASGERRLRSTSAASALRGET